MTSETPAWHAERNVSTVDTWTADSTPADMRVVPGDPVEPGIPKFLSREAYHTLLAQIHWLGAAHVQLDSTWRSDVRWGRNRITKSGDWRNVSVNVSQGTVQAHTNQTDLISQQALVHWAERMRQQCEGGTLALGPYTPVKDRRAFPATHIWSEATYQQTQDTRLDIATQLVASAENTGMLSAGYLSVEARGAVFALPDGRVEYFPMTEAQCSITVRAPDGQGSGWAGRSSYDWGRIGAERLAAIALDKCLKSRNPVRIEPGRYTLVMEPQATFELIKALFSYPVPRQIYDYLDLQKNFNATYPFHDARTVQVPVSRFDTPYEIKGTKLGQRVFDERITLRWDPLDPDLGRIPFTWRNGEVYPVRPVAWVKNGILTALGYEPGITEIQGFGDRLDPAGVLGPGSSFRMEGGTTTIEEMIATTKRGLIVTRFSKVEMQYNPSILLTGITRDGLWLIENGKITHPVQNLRFTESPLFVFNQVEQIGSPVPIFSPGLPAMTPPVKVRDFSFTALNDAV